MKKVIGLVLFTVAMLVPTVAKAAPVPVIVAPTTFTVGVPATFDSAGSVCDTSVCSYTWTATWRNSNYRTFVLATRVDTTFTYTPTVADTGRVVTVLLKVTSNNSTNNFRTAQVSFRAQPAPAPVAA